MNVSIMFRLTDSLYCHYAELKYLMPLVGFKWHEPAVSAAQGKLTFCCPF